jgi:hypothetical protein
MVRGSWRCMVRRVVTVIAALVLAAEASAATVVLTSGKRLDVASYTVSGNYVILQYASGRKESYPLSTVDLAATRQASGEKAPVPAAPQPSGPHSPFLGAKSTGGTSAVAINDSDVSHVTTPVPGEEKKEAESAAPVVLLGFDKKKVAEGQWDIIATVANQGANVVQGVTAQIRVLDSGGQTIASGSGSLSGGLAPGKQSTITARVAMEGEPVQVGVDLNWQEIRAVEKPVGTPQPTAPPKPTAESPKASPTPLPSWSIPADASPNSMPSNPMALPQPNNTGTSGQVPRPTPKS